ncbi:MAG TPA: hypothetical protein VFT22_24550 [Kofleriaceae bacterium]|nr:hypothetical protein [Kofleriaceae bacterium]
MTAPRLPGLRISRRADLVARTSPAPRIPQIAATTRSARRAAGVIAALAALGTPVAASPLSDALARHTAADVAALRAQPGDAARCTLGAVHARRNDLPRAALYLADCERRTLPDDIAPAVRAAVRDVKRRLDGSRLAALDILSVPEGLTAQIDALPGESFTTPAKIWVEPGVHEVQVSAGARTWTQRVTTEPHKDATAIIEARLIARPPAPRTQAIDFGNDEPGGALGEQHTGPPPAIQHPPLISDRYRGIPAPAAEGPIDDPLAARAAPTPERRLWLGLRVGGGLFDDGSAAARAGLALAVAGRFRLADGVFGAGRIDWSRRGGDAMSGGVDVIGASAGLGATVVRRAGVALAVIGQLRGDLRLADVRDAAPVRRAGLGVAGGLELALPATPLALGVRLEQGVTELVPGARDRAFLVELGVDLR